MAYKNWIQTSFHLVSYYFTYTILTFLSSLLDLLSSIQQVIQSHHLMFFQLDYFAKLLCPSIHWSIIQVQVPQRLFVYLQAFLKALNDCFIFDHLLQFHWKNLHLYFILLILISLLLYLRFVLFIIKLEYFFSELKKSS